MLKSSDRILTSHAGSLPRPDDLIAVNAQREAGKIDEASFQKELTKGVADVVRRQKEAGIAVPGDGEYGKSMGSKINYRAWWSYSFDRLSGLKIEDIDRDTLPVHRSTPGNVHTPSGRQISTYSRPGDGGCCHKLSQVSALRLGEFGGHYFRPH